MSSKRRRRGRGTRVAALVLGLLASLLCAPAAAATTLGTLAFTPDHGASIDPASVTTASSGAVKGCPSPTTHVEGWAVGPGAWASPGVIVVSQTSAGVSTSADFSVQMADNWAGIAASNLLQLVAGRYDVTLRCEDVNGVNIYGEFGSPVWFTDATHWQSTDPAASTSTTTALSTDPPSGAAAGASVSLTAKVTPSAATGTVQFTDTVGATTTNLGAPVTVSAGQATLATSAVAAGTHGLAAVFTPATGSAFTTSTAATVAYTITAPVGAIPTSTTLSASPSGGAQAGAAVALTAIVTPATATGAVQFTDTVGGVTSDLGTAVTLTSGSATLTTSTLAQGSHSLGAVFTTSDPNGFLSSSANVIGYTIAMAGDPAVVGTLAFVPPSGTDIDPATINTQSTGAAKGCPAGTGQVEGWAVGPGDWAVGILVVSATTAGVSTSADFQVQMSESWAGIAANNLIQVVAGRYDITLRCEDSSGVTVFGTFTASIWFTDAKHWQSSDPSNSQTLTQTMLVATPLDRADLGEPVTVTAVVTPPTVAGKIQFKQVVSGTVSNLGPPVTVTNGTATFTTASLPFSLYFLRAVYLPNDSTKFAASTSADALYVVALPIPPLPPRTAILTGTPRVGAPLACSAVFRNARRTGWQWLRDGRVIAMGAAGYRVSAADRGHLLSCLAFASNAGGTTFRVSAPERVSR